jgi:MoxR-like ATPase
MDEKIEDYIVSIVHATREPADYGIGDITPLIQYGASPRASIYLALSAPAPTRSCRAAATCCRTT